MSKQVIVEITGAGPQGPEGKEGPVGETGAEGKEGPKGLNGLNGVGVLLYESFNEASELAPSESVETPELMGEPDSITFSVPEGGRTVQISFDVFGNNPGTGQAFIGLYIDGVLQYNAHEFGLFTEFGNALEQHVHTTIYKEGLVVADNHEGEHESASKEGGAPLLFFLPGGTHKVDLRMANEDRTTGNFSKRRLVVTMPGPVASEEGGGGGGETIVSNNEAPEEATIKGEEGEFALMPTPDSCSFVLAQDSIVLFSFKAIGEGKDKEKEEVGRIAIFLDGVQFRGPYGNEMTGAAFEGQTKANYFRTPENIESESQEGEVTPHDGAVISIFLKAGEHKIDLRMRGGTWFKRRLVVKT